LDDLKSDVHKIQVAFESEETQLEDLGLEILHQEGRGSIKLIVIRGNEDEVVQKINDAKPLVFDRLPLTLEEIFIYETEGASSDEIPY